MTLRPRQLTQASFLQKKSNVAKWFFDICNAEMAQSLSHAQCSEWVSKPKFFGDGFFDFNVAFSMYIMTMSSQKLLICHENIVKMVLNPVHLEHFS